MCDMSMRIAYVWPRSVQGQSHSLRLNIVWLRPFTKGNNSDFHFNKLTPFSILQWMVSSSLPVVAIAVYCYWRSRRIPLGKLSYFCYRLYQQALFFIIMFNILNARPRNDIICDGIWYLHGLWRLRLKFNGGIRYCAFQWLWNKFVDIKSEFLLCILSFAS